MDAYSLLLSSLSLRAQLLAPQYTPHNSPTAAAAGVLAAP
jgi:hypothetical protein